MTSKGRSSIHRGFFSALHCLRRGDMVTVLSQIHLFSLSYSTSCNKTACIFIQAIEWLYSLSIMYQPETKQAIWQWMNAIFLIQPCPWYTKVGDQILTGIKCGKTRLDTFLLLKKLHFPTGISHPNHVFLFLSTQSMWRISSLLYDTLTQVKLQHVRLMLEGFGRVWAAQSTAINQQRIHQAPISMSLCYPKDWQHEQCQGNNASDMKQQWSKGSYKKT